MALAETLPDDREHELSFASLEVVSAVREVEALVAEREIGDLLVSQGHRQPGPVVERGVDDLVAREPALAVGQGHVADLAAPAFHERNHQVIGLQRPRLTSARTARRATPGAVP